MKILYIANSRIPTEKAHGLQIMKTIEAFLETGQDVTLLIPRRKNPIKERVESFYNLRKMPKMVYVPNLFTVFESRLNFFYFPLQRFFFTLYSLVFGLLSKADVVYSREITISFFLSFFGKNIVFEDHEPKKKFRFLYNFFIRHINKKVIVASNLVQLYEKAGVAKGSYVVAPNGVDLLEFDSIQPDKHLWSDLPAKKVVLYVGHFYEWKGVYTLLSAAKSIDASVILIGGSGKWLTGVQKYIKDQNLKNVFVFAFMSHDKIIAYMKSADVLVLPNTAKEERSSLYTTPIKLFEYMASGVPIVASNLKSFAPYVRDKVNAVLFEPDNSQDLSEKISFILKNTENGKVLAMQAHSDASKYTWRRRASTILEFIMKS